MLAAMAVYYRLCHVLTDTDEPRGGIIGSVHVRIVQTVSNTPAMKRLTKVMIDHPFVSMKRLGTRQGQRDGKGGSSSLASPIFNINHSAQFHIMPLLVVMGLVCAR